MQNVPYDNIRGIPGGLIKRRNGMGKQAVIRVHKRQIASLNMVHSPVTGFRHALIFLPQDEEAAVLLHKPPNNVLTAIRRPIINAKAGPLRVILLLQASQARFKGCGGIIQMLRTCSLPDARAASRPYPPDGHQRVKNSPSHQARARVPA